MRVSIYICSNDRHIVAFLNGREELDVQCAVAQGQITKTFRDTPKVRGKWQCYNKSNAQRQYCFLMMRNPRRNVSVTTDRETKRLGGYWQTRKVNDFCNLSSTIGYAKNYVSMSKVIYSHKKITCLERHIII